MIPRMPGDEFAVRRRDFAIEDPWAVPAGCEEVVLRRATDGADARLATSVVAFHDDRCINFLFRGDDDHVVATHLQHDAPLYEEDVVEVFLAPRMLTEYYEIEVNPLATTFDARIESPDGARATMRADRGWECAGLFAATRRTRQPAATWFETIIRIPFESLGCAPSGAQPWRANFFRIDRHPGGDEFLAWQPTLRVPADFHLPSAFGVLRFEGS